MHSSELSSPATCVWPRFELPRMRCPDGRENRYFAARGISQTSSVSAGVRARRVRGVGGGGPANRRRRGWQRALINPFSDTLLSGFLFTPFYLSHFFNIQKVFICHSSSMLFLFLFYFLRFFLSEFSPRSSKFLHLLRDVSPRLHIPCLPSLSSPSFRLYSVLLF